MECFNCGFPLSELGYCTSCGADVRKYKKIMYTANRLYNDGLDRAGVRDLSGAVRSLRGALRCNKNHIEARNLLGLVYYEMGEAVAAFVEWVISKNIRPEKNLADEYINMVQSDKGRLETIGATLKKYNVALELCNQGDRSYDLAIIQLKKVLSLNPKFVKARKLLALLYLQKGEWDKAKKGLEACRAIDCGDVDTLRYLQEAEIGFYGGDLPEGRKKKITKDNEASVIWNNGNETIIQPLRKKENIGLTVFLQIGLGILVGALVGYFLLVPARETAVRSESNAKQVELGEQIDSKNAEISDLNSRIRELEQNIADQRSELEDYTGANGVLTANDHLQAAAYAYLDKEQSVMTVEQYLGMIPETYLENASPEFQELYTYLKTEIGDSVAESYYESGLAAYRQQDYAVAIADLEKAVLYDPSNDDALYYLGVSYYDSGNVSTAAEKFNQLISVFPESAQADKARQRLEEIGE
ncbi:MAG: tetratricopeptide repeat protein [Lachnospiraceae bacterium]|nr:tetratricopeptide repeat protein [Lachnospiraceae bacterium]